MNLIGTKAWMWINAICLIIVGAISLVPAIASLIDVILLSLLKIAVAMISIIVSFRETDMEMINGKIWLMFVGVILLFMGVFPFFPEFMMAYPTFVDFLNAMKVVLGVVTFLAIIMDWPKYSP